MRPFLLLLSSLIPLCEAGCGRDVTANPRAVELATEEPAAPQREQGENPLYTRWAKFRPGTAVVQRSITETQGTDGKTTTTTTSTLLELTEEQVVTELKSITKRYDGAVIDAPAEKFTNARWIRLPPGVKKADFGKPAAATEQGEETVRVAGRDFATRWTKGKDRNEAGEVLVTTWTSDDVPGGLVKSVTRIPAIGKTTTSEVVEIREP